MRSDLIKVIEKQMIIGIHTANTVLRICKGLQLTFLWTPRPSRNGSTATAALYDSTSFMDEETRDPPASTTIILLTMLTKVFLLLLTSFSDLHLFSTLENGLLLPFCVSDREARNNTQKLEAAREERACQSSYSSSRVKMRK